MASNDDLQMCKMKSSPMSGAVVERSVTVTINMSWQVHAASKLVTNSSCRLLQSFPDRISGMRCFKEILKAVDQATLCPGNPDPEFVELFKGNHTVSFLDVTTIRHSQCEVLCERNGRFPKRCRKCCDY